MDPSCPACHGGLRPLRLVIDGRYQLHRCRDCRTQLLRARDRAPDASEYWEQYKFDMYASDDVQADYERRYQRILDITRQRIGPVASVLDMGCGIGNFLDFARRAGTDAVGVDVEPDAVQTARGRGLTAFLPDELDADVSDGSVDAATMWDVIEHLTDPEPVLTDLVRKVRPGGAIIIETPDATFPARPLVRGLHYLSGGRTARVTGHLYYWEHKIYFTRQGLSHLVRRAGCDVVGVLGEVSPRAKMSRIFAHYAAQGELPAKVMVRAWPLVSRAMRQPWLSNKLILLARRRPTPG
jgi:2-polyprenyl-3-methyl-5-hydroxy-6-metoxy-1,4-benzoquinol methylase